MRFILNEDTHTNNAYDIWEELKREDVSDCHIFEFLINKFDPFDLDECFETLMEEEGLAIDAEDTSYEDVIDHIIATDYFVDPYRDMLIWMIEYFGYDESTLIMFLNELLNDNRRIEILRPDDFKNKAEALSRKKKNKDIFITPNPGDPEAMDSFNNSTSDSVTESIGLGYNRQQLIDAIKEFGVKYKFDKYTNQQLYKILNQLNDKKNNNTNSKKKNSKRNLKIHKDYDNPTYNFVGTVNDKGIYFNKKTSEYEVEGYTIGFASEEDAADFARE